MEVVRHCYCEAKVRSSSVSVVYVLRLRIFSKGALQKRGSIEPIEPPLDPPLYFIQFLAVLHAFAKPDDFKFSREKVDRTVHWCGDSNRRTTGELPSA